MSTKKQSRILEKYNFKILMMEKHKN